MINRGEIPIKIVFYILVSVVVLILLFFLLSTFLGKKKSYSDMEIINLKTSIQTKVLQQNVRAAGSNQNFSFSVPKNVKGIYFFNPNISFNRFVNPDLTLRFSSDMNDNFFVETTNGFRQYKIDGLIFDKGNNPLSVKIINSKINLQLISTGRGVRIEAASDEVDASCVSVFENGDAQNKIDIVFLGYGFSDVSEYNSEVNKYINDILLRFQPFAEFRDRFNFYRIDDAKISCNIGSFIDCNQFEIKVAASDCPNDYIFVLVDRSKVSDFIRPVRSSAISNIAKINVADKPYVLIHEFGHSFGDLADEYVDESYYSQVDFDANHYANCDYTPCVSWKGLENTSCYQGCSLRKYYRPTQDSVMRSLDSETYGPVNERELLRRLLFYE